jgi:hypothetical protein
VVEFRLPLIPLACQFHENMPCERVTQPRDLHDIRVVWADANLASMGRIAQPNATPTPPGIGTNLEPWYVRVLEGPGWKLKAWSMGEKSGEMAGGSGPGSRELR